MTAAAPAPHSAHAAVVNGLVNSDKAFAYKVIVFAVATLADQRDSDTESHLIRVQHYTRLLTQQLAATPEFAATLTPEGIEQLIDSIPLYDLGTVGVPDRVLLKPAALDDCQAAAVVLWHRTPFPLPRFVLQMQQPQPRACLRARTCQTSRSPPPLIVTTPRGKQSKSAPTRS